MLLQAERATTGVFNLTGPALPLTLGDLLDAARETLNPAAQLHWVDEPFLLEQGVAPWSDLPVWLPRAQAGMLDMNIAAALGSGLQCRPLAQTLEDTAAWAADENAAPRPATTGLPRPPVGLSAQREAELLLAWRSRPDAADSA